MRKVRSLRVVIASLFLLIGVCFAAHGLGTALDGPGGAGPGAAMVEVDLPVVCVIVLGGLIMLLRPRKRRVVDTVDSEDARE